MTVRCSVQGYATSCEVESFDKADEIDDDDSESECEDSMSIFNVDTFDIDHSRTSFVEDAMRIDLQEVAR